MRLPCTVSILEPAEPNSRSAAADGSTGLDANLVTTLSKDEVVRHISQVFCLERLAASDIPMARSLLSALVQVWFWQVVDWTAGVNVSSSPILQALAHLRMLGQLNFVCATEGEAMHRR